MSRHPGLRLARCGGALILVAAACTRGAGGPTPSGLDDADVAAILLSANNTDIAYANLASSRAEAVAIKTFAQRMLTDHATVNRLIADIDARIGVTPRDNALSFSFRDASARERDLLRSVVGRAFDTTYIANEVAFHRHLVGAIDSVLAPSVRDPQLKQLVVAYRPAVAAHLAHAEQIRAALRAER